MPTVLTAIGDTLSLPDDFLPDVINHVLRRAYEMDENESMMNYKRQEFENSMLELTDEERQAQNMTYETITVYSDRLY